MFLNPTSVTEIRKIISKMQPKNSTGIDEIPTSVVKSSSDYILVGLCHIFNLSLSQGQFVTDYKKARVIPVHKKEQKTNVNNYRPISLLPVLSNTGVGNCFGLRATSRSRMLAEGCTV